MILERKLSFRSQVKEKISKVKQGLGVMKQLLPYVPRRTLEEIYKLYVRPHIDYGDIIYHIPDN